MHPEIEEKMFYKSFAACRPARALLLGIFMGLALPAPAAMADMHIIEISRFRISVAGFNAGIIAISALKKRRNYSVSGLMTTTGIISALIKIGYNGSVSGRFRGASYRPAHYRGQTSTGSRDSVVEIRYRSGRPKVVAYAPKRAAKPYDLQASAQRGTLDPLTAAYLLLRDVPKAELCNKSLKVFDGKRRSRLAVGQPAASGNRVQCNGVYTRIAGFAPKLMKKQVNFPFTLNYVLQDDGIYRLQEFTTKTTFGTARGRRR
jgi:uncharacterized protein DUF3108